MEKLTSYEQCDDRCLTQRVAEGDSRAFEELFTRHRDAIYAMLVKRTGNTEDVNDLMQEAFMKAFVNIRRYNPDYDFGGWICTIAKNAFVDFDRSRRSRPLNPNNNLPLDGERVIAARTTLPTPEESVINAQQRADIERYIERLPEDYRRLFELRFLDEYSYEEIAEKLDMKLGTVKTRIFRVRALMCRLISEGESM